MKKIIWQIGVLAAALLPLQAEEDAYLGKTMWGLSTQNVAAETIPELKAEPELGEVWRITIVAPGATGEQEGLRKGDLVLSIDGKKPTEFNISNVSGSRGGKLAVGDKIPVRVLKYRDGKASVEELELETRRYFENEKVPYREPAGAKEFENAESEHWRTAEPVIAGNQWEERFADLLQRLENTDVYQDPYRLPIFSYLIRNPFRIEAVSRSVVDRIKQCGQQPVKLLDCAQYLLEFAEPAPQENPLPEFKGGDLAAHLDYIEAVLKQADQWNRQAFSRISEEERDFVLANREALLDSFIFYKMLTYEPDTELTCRSLEVCRILNRIDREALFRQARTAGLLLAAILSDTLMFRSPTCTPVDENTAKRLAKIAGVDIEEFSTEMFEAGEKLDGKTPEEVFLQDFKVFMCGDIRFGVAQGSYMTRKNLQAAQALLQPYLEEARNKQNVEDIYMLLTDVPKEESVVICTGRYAAEVLSNGFESRPAADGSWTLPGVVSRKKQFIPAMMSAYQEL